MSSIEEKSLELPQIPMKKESNKEYGVSKKKKDQNLPQIGPINEVVGSLQANNTPATLNIEGQRILSVLQEAQRKFDFISAIPEFPERRLIAHLGEDVYNFIHDTRNQEIRYQSIYDQLLESYKEEVGKDPKSDIDPQKIYALNNFTPELKEEAKTLRSLYRALLRSLMAIPNAISKLKTQTAPSIEPLEAFNGLWDQLINLIQEKLQVTVEEDKRKQELLSYISTKEKKVLDEIAQLEQELSKAKNERKAEIDKRNETIKKLKANLKDIKSNAEDIASKLETKSKMKEETDVQSFKDKEKVLLPEIEGLQKRLTELRKANQEDEINLRKKKFKIETEVENWIHKYDQEMEEKQNELEETAAIYKEEKNQLGELEDRFAELKKEYDAIMEEKRLAQETAKKEQELLSIKTKAATKLQALFRGYLTRRNEKRKKSGGKEKKKSAGKKK